MVASKQAPASKATTKKKSSPQKVAANRRNASRSTGPVTREGMERCCFNAVKHGLFARVLPKERHPFMVDPEEYRTLIALYTTDFDPKTEFETTLVDLLHALSAALLQGVKPAFEKSDRVLLVTMITTCHGNAAEALADAGPPEQGEGDNSGIWQLELARSVVAPVKVLATAGTIEDKIRAVVAGKERVDADAWAILLQIMSQNRTSEITRLEKMKRQWKLQKSKHIQRHLEHFDRLELMNRYETMVRRHIDRTLTQLRTFRQGIEGRGSGSVPHI